MNLMALTRNTALVALVCMSGSVEIYAAGSSHNLATNGTATIVVDSWLEHVPPTGLMPMRVKVRNDGPSARSWDFISVDSDFMSGEMKGSFTFGAAAHGESTTELLVPVMPDYEAGRSYSNLRVVVDGPALMGPGTFFLTASSSASSSSSSTSGPKPYFGVGQEFENVFGSAWRALAFSSGSREFRGDVVQMSMAPTDWRGYSALAQLWITDGEWSALSAMQREAIMTWVASGGCLVVYAKDPINTLALPEGFAPWKGERLSHGLGEVILINGADALKTKADDVVGLARAGSFARIANVQPDQRDRLSGLLPALQMNQWLIFGFILVFGIVVGPVNLFWFARGNRRPRMFWTTPLISFVVPQCSWS